MSSPIQATSDISLDQTDYLTLFMQELTYQDPLKPLDNREFMGQMAQFSALQEARSTNAALETLLGMTSANQTLMMLGKKVKYKGGEDYGTVRQVQFPEGAAPKLTIEMNGSTVEKQLTDITDVY